VSRIILRETENFYLSITIYLLLIHINMSNKAVTIFLENYVKQVKECANTFFQIRDDSFKYFNIVTGG